MIRFFVSSRPAAPPKRKPAWVVTAAVGDKCFVVYSNCKSFHDANSKSTMLSELEAQDQDALRHALCASWAEKEGNQ